jgi:phosphatidylserine decarboxylase
MRVELAWGWLRRWRLRTFRPAYVERMRQRRRGVCPGCPTDIVDARDLKYVRNVCGYWFDAVDEPYDWLRRLPIAPIARGEVLVYGGTALGLAAAASLLSMWAAVPFLLAALFVLWFFRDPPRRIPSLPGAIMAPADGVITRIEEVEESGLWDGPALRISIYLSVFSVHINRAPESARVIEVRYYPGELRNTWDIHSARDNEQAWTVLESLAAPHPRMLVKQIAGPFARRIVCSARPGEVLARGDRLGMIKFGSRTELYLQQTPGLQLRVQVGDRVRGGQSILAQLDG